MLQELKMERLLRTHSEVSDSQESLLERAGQWKLEQARGAKGTGAASGLSGAYAETNTGLHKPDTQAAGDGANHHGVGEG